MSEYKRTCHDELEWIDIEQLHAATLQSSKSCFEFKKMCVALIGAALALVANLTEKQLDQSYFLIPLCICLGFWIADATAYYAQRSTRRTMDGKFRSIASRNGLNDYDRTDTTVSWWNAFTNSSMVLYEVLAVFAIAGECLLCFEIIGKHP